jgi:predicted short-subunit dehydrogenase-like oxidoreductase (DUF2520 family)
MEYSISIVGTGNAAWSLGKHFKKTNHRLVAVISRKKASASSFRDEIGAEKALVFDEIIPSCDFIFLCVPDNEIASCSQNINYEGQPVVCHVSGAASINLLNNHTRHGVLYPLQTLKKYLNVLEPADPVLIEGNDPDSARKLMELASTISEHPVLCDTPNRLIYHLAAVFVNNFSNLMYLVAKKLTEPSGLDFNLLKPLIYRTISNADQFGPAKSVTGPAARHDHSTMQKHLELLKDDPDAKDLYAIASRILMKNDP